MKKIKIFKEKVKMSFDITKPLKMLLILTVLCVIGYWSFKIRAGSIDDEYISDFDPWAHFRHAEDIIKNNYKPPVWDIFSHYPPGRPYVEQSGWAYTLIILNKIFNLFGTYTMMYTSRFASVIFAVLTLIPAYFLGKKISNTWGGLATAFFIGLIPTFLQVSSIGYIDTDVTVVFFTFLVGWVVVESVENKKWWLYLLSGFCVYLFSFMWKSSWYIFDIFIAWLVGWFVFRTLVELIRHKKVELNDILKEVKPMGISLLIIFIVGNILAILPLGGINFIDSLKVSLGFIQEGLIVNVSVAELQLTKIFTLNGFKGLIDRISYSVILTLLTPFLLLYKYVKKIEIKKYEILLIIWLTVCLFLLTKGYRFGLLFSCISAICGGYFVGNIVSLTKNMNVVFRSVILGSCTVILILCLKASLPYADLSISSLSQNWVDGMLWLKNNTAQDSVVVTWWDPGHIISGLAERRNFFDGAHCNDVECPISGHNKRIQDMGRIFSTTNESEAINILKKDLTISAEECADLFNYMEDNFKVTPPVDACKSPSEVYYISSNDLIPKFTWLNYFGGYGHNIESSDDYSNNPGQCCAVETKPQSGVCKEGSWVYCPWNFNIVSTQVDGLGRPVYIYEYAGVRINIINTGSALVPTYINKYVINDLYIENQHLDLRSFGNDTEHMEGFVFLSSNLQNLLFINDKIKDSVFVKTLLFEGEGLEHFKLVYKNAEMTIFKVDINE